MTKLLSARYRISRKVDFSTSSMIIIPIGPLDARLIIRLYTCYMKDEIYLICVEWFSFLGVIGFVDDIRKRTLSFEGKQTWGVTESFLHYVAKLRNKVDADVKMCKLFLLNLERLLASFAYRSKRNFPYNAHITIENMRILALTNINALITQKAFDQWET